MLICFIVVFLVVKGGQALQTGSERRRKSTPEKFIEPSGLSDSEEDQLEVTETTTEQLQGELIEDGQTDRQTDKQTDGQTDRQTDRQITNRQTCSV